MAEPTKGQLLKQLEARGFRRIRHPLREELPSLDGIVQTAIVLFVIGPIVFGLIVSVIFTGLMLSAIYDHDTAGQQTLGNIWKTVMVYGTPGAAVLFTVLWWYVRWLGYDHLVSTLRR
jgi:hypothetical protein